MVNLYREGGIIIWARGEVGNSIWDEESIILYSHLI